MSKHETTLQAIRENHAPLPVSMTRWTGYLLNRAGQLNREYFEALLEPMGLTARHYTTLALLNEAQPLAQKDIAERLWLDKNTVVILLNTLERSGLAERQSDARDKRAHAVVLTEAGMAAYHQATELLEQVNQETMAPLTSAEQGQLRQLLLRLM